MNHADLIGYLAGLLELLLAMSVFYLKIRYDRRTVENKLEASTGHDRMMPD